MKPEVVEAIRGSIAKWEGIINGSGVDEGTDNCPLCAMFLAAQCSGCPIRDKMGKSYCRGTPIEVWRELSLKHFGKSEKRFYAATPVSLEIAKTVLQFLKNLLPEESDPGHIPDHGREL